MFNPTATEEEIAKGMAQIQFKENYILKRGIGGAMNCVFKKNVLEENKMKKQIKKIIQKNNFNGAYWLLQPWISQLQNGEMKLYFINGKYSYGFIMQFEKIGPGSKFNVQELRIDSSMWNTCGVPSAIKLGEKVYAELIKKAPSLAVVFRLDVFRDETGAFIINELEHFGNMWFSFQHTTIAEEKLSEIAIAISEYFIRSFK